MPLKGSEEYYRARASKDPWKLDPARNDRYLQLIKDQTDRTIGQLADQGALRAKGEETAWSGIGDIGGKAMQGYYAGQDRARAEEDRQDKRAVNKKTMELDDENIAGMKSDRGNREKGYEIDNQNVAEEGAPAKTRRQQKADMETERTRLDVEGAKLENEGKGIANAGSQKTNDRIGKLSPEEEFNRQQVAKEEAKAKVKAALGAAQRYPEGSPQRVEFENYASEIAKSAELSATDINAAKSDASAAAIVAKKAAATSENVTETTKPGYEDAKKKLDGIASNVETVNRLINDYTAFENSNSITQRGPEGIALANIKKNMTPEERDEISSGGIGGRIGTKVRDRIISKRNDLEAQIREAKISARGISTLEEYVITLENQLVTIDQALAEGKSAEAVGKRRAANIEIRDKKAEKARVQQAGGGASGGGAPSMRK